MKLMMTLIALLTFSQAFAGNEVEINAALAKVREATYQLQLAEVDLRNALNNNSRNGWSCRIHTSLYTYVAQGQTRQSAVDNAVAKCIASGTIADVCRRATVGSCEQL